MLALFPDLLTYNLLAPVIVRLALGLILIYFAYTKLFKSETVKQKLFKAIGFGGTPWFLIVLAGLEFFAGLLLIIGLFTQGVGLVLGFFMLIAAHIKTRQPKSLPGSVVFYFLLSAVSFSLVFSGAGIFAVDLPL